MDHIGIDVHKRESQIYILAAAGEVVEQVEFATLYWVAWYNGHRLLEPLGYVPLDEFERAYYRHQTAQAELATLTQ